MSSELGTEPQDTYTYVSPRPESGLVMDHYDYHLPESAIAQRPVEPRDSARLLVALDDGPPIHQRVDHLPQFLESGDLLVVNETRVIPARLNLRKDTGGAVEVFLLERITHGGWQALVKPSRKIAPGTTFHPGPGLVVEVGAVLLEGGQRRVRLLGDDGTALSPEEEQTQLERYGSAPLPPYITETLPDSERYQTTYARIAGSAAAPTAGLHFTPELFAALTERGVNIAKVDLCVGLDTFRPVTADKPEDHDIHSERYSVPAATWGAVQRTRTTGKRVVAVGTTTVRSLETAAASGVLEGRTKLLIYGDYPFGVVDVLMTNFHLPRSSLLLLVEAFVGPRWKDLYANALDEGYRFLSLGDALLLGRRRY